jgi:hypothetical protein
MPRLGHRPRQHPAPADKGFSVRNRLVLSSVTIGVNPSILIDRCTAALGLATADIAGRIAAVLIASVSDIVPPLPGSKAP